MNPLAKQMLESLLAAGERQSAGVRTRLASLTAAHLKPYREGRSLQQKDDFEATVRAASAAGATHISWDDGVSAQAFISRIDIVDVERLALFLGRTPQRQRLSDAEALVAPHCSEFPVILDLLAHWARLRKVRGLGPEDAQDWLDAVAVIRYARNRGDTIMDLPIREASARLFRDSKRLERLAGAVDVLLTGDLELGARDHVDVWQELGIYREEQPVRMAGTVVVRRSRVTACLDAPYGAFSPSSVEGLDTGPLWVRTIENLTTFHSEARKLCDEAGLLIYTGGMPSPSWRAMYLRLLRSVPAGTPIYHWGDVDEGGFRIASVIAADVKSAGHVLTPWRMSPEDVPLDGRRTSTPAILSRMRRFATAAGWEDLGAAVEAAGFTIEQEALG